MVINSSKIKTEALLLFARDLIDSYKSSNNELFDIDENIKKFIDNKIEQLSKAINIVVQPTPYYLRNKNVSRITMILKTHKYLNTNISKYFKDGDKFNPSMLCFALLCSWFAEHSITDKEFIFFSLYPYDEIYDKLLINIPSSEYRVLNITMLNIAEEVIYKLYSYRFK